MTVSEYVPFQHLQDSFNVYKGLLVGLSVDEGEH